MPPRSPVMLATQHAAGATQPTALAFPWAALTGPPLAALTTRGRARPRAGPHHHPWGRAAELALPRASGAARGTCPRAHSGTFSDHLTTSTRLPPGRLCAAPPLGRRHAPLHTACLRPRHTHAPAAALSPALPAATRVQASARPRRRARPPPTPPRPPGTSLLPCFTADAPFPLMPAPCLPPTRTSAPAVHAPPAPGAAPGPAAAAVV